MQDAWHYQIKAAQRDLIAAAGGIERVVGLTSYSKSVVGRWNNPADPELMTLVAVRVLELDTDKPLITTIMAHETGRKVTEPNGPVTDAATLDALARQLLLEVVEVASLTTVATNDRHVSPAEATTIGHPAGRARETLRAIDRLLGSVKADGGLKIVGEGA